MRILKQKEFCDIRCLGTGIILGHRMSGTSKVINKNNSGQILRLSSTSLTTSRSGQVMVEAMVALSVITVGILGVFTLTTSSIGYSRVAADRYVAVNLANEGIELTKNLIDRNIMDETAPSWNYLPGLINGISDYKIDYNDSALSSSNGEYLYFSKDGSGYYRYDIQDVNKDKPTEFQRIISIENISSNHLKVISKVYWNSRKSSYDFSVEDHFYDLQMFKYNNNQPN